MVAQAATPDRTPPLRRATPLRRVGQAVLAAATLAWLAVAGWLCGRRLTGGVEQPLGLAPLWAVGLAAAALISALRWGWGQVGVWPTRTWAPATLWWLLPVMAALMLVVFLSVRGVSAPALAAWGAILVVHEALWGRSLRRAGPPCGSATEPAAGPEVPAGVDDRPAAGPSRRSPDDEDHPQCALPAEICQQITRSQSPSHGDAMAGVLRASFQPGERSRHVHVALCPPMQGRPSVEVVQLSGPPTRVKAADVQPFGIRFDVRLAAVSPRAEDVLIHFEARCMATAPAAVPPPDRPSDPISHLSG